MSEQKPVIVTLDQVRATARTIVNHQSTRGALGVSVHHIIALAQTVCALDDIAKAAAEWIATREWMLDAVAGSDAYQAADDELNEIDAELTSALAALGYLTTPEQETTDASA